MSLHPHCPGLGVLPQLRDSGWSRARPGRGGDPGRRTASRTCHSSGSGRARLESFPTRCRASGVAPLASSSASRESIESDQHSCGRGGTPCRARSGPSGCGRQGPHAGLRFSVRAVPFSASAALGGSDARPSAQDQTARHHLRDLGRDCSALRIRLSTGSARAGSGPGCYRPARPCGYQCCSRSIRAGPFVGRLSALVSTLRPGYGFGPSRVRPFDQAARDLSGRARGPPEGARPVIVTNRHPRPMR